MKLNKCSYGNGHTFRSHSNTDDSLWMTPRCFDCGVNLNNLDKSNAIACLICKIDWCADCLSKKKVLVPYTMFADPKGPQDEDE